jgi:hypothetical protein
MSRTKPICSFGKNCAKTNDVDHMKKYYHATQLSSSKEIPKIIREEYESKITRLQNKNSMLKDEIKTIREDHKEEKATIRRTHREKLADLEGTHKEEKSKMRKAHRNDIAKLSA